MGSGHVLLVLRTALQECVGKVSPSQEARQKAVATEPNEDMRTEQMEMTARCIDAASCWETSNETVREDNSANRPNSGTAVGVQLKGTVGMEKRKCSVHASALIMACEMCDDCFKMTRTAIRFEPHAREKIERMHHTSRRLQGNRHCL